MIKNPKILLLIETDRGFGRDMLKGIIKYSHIKDSWTFYRQRQFLSVNMESLKKWGINGIIGHESALWKVADLLSLDVPTIFCPAADIINEKLVNITSDDEAIGKMAADYFTVRGFKNFAYCGLAGHLWSEKRGSSFESAVMHGSNTFFAFQDFSKERLDYESEQQIISNWLKSLPKPIAILTCNDDRAENILNACSITGIRSPEQVAVLGCDNDQYICSLTYPTLSSIAYNTEFVGYQAAEMLDKLISEDKFEHDSIDLKPTHIVTRQSTDITAVEDADVAKALMFIRENINEPIQTLDVVEAVLVSRRTLERKFRNSLKTSISEEIKRFRINHIIKLLSETDLSIIEISHQLGFSDAAHISRYFYNKMKMSPSDYRKQLNK